MSGTERQRTSSEAVPRSGRRAADRTGAGAGRTPQDGVLELQRLAGNAAVARVVQRFELSDAVHVLQVVGGPAGAVLGLGFSVLLAEDREGALVEGLARSGYADRGKLTNLVFWLRHPDRVGARIGAEETALAAEWVAIRRDTVDPALRRAKAAGGGGSGTRPGGGSGGGSAKPMTEEERARLIEAAQTQGSSGSEKLHGQMENALPEGTTLDGWFGRHVPDASFLGKAIRASGGSTPGVHQEFLARLQLAEADLRGKFPGQDDAQLRTTLGLRDIGGLRPPKLATGGTLPSMHCFGMAVDINAATNPFVGNAKVSKKVTDPVQRAELAENRSPRIIARAMLLVHGEAFDVESRLRGDVAAVYDLHARASEALAQYLSLAGAGAEALTEPVARARAAGDGHDAAWWAARIARDREVLPSWDFGHSDHPEETGYLDLNRELVLSLTDAGGLTWGGMYNTGKDMMHFDYRDGSIQRR